METELAHEAVRSAVGFRHEAFLYGDRDTFVTRMTRFLRDGLAAGAPALVVVDAPKIQLLRSALGTDADAVEFADMDEVGDNPARMIPAWQDFVERHRGAPRLRGIGEPVNPRRDPDALAECHLHEALLNVAFADAPRFDLVCPYDTTGLSREVVARARRTHPIVGRHHSRAYCDSREIEAGFAQPLPPPPQEAAEFPFDVHSLAMVRSLVAERARAAGLEGARASDLLLAANEVASNSVRHGGGSGVLRVWSGEDRLLCEVENSGSIDDPLVGRRRPGADQSGGFGVWIANQVCDLVQIRSARGRAVVRLHMRTA